MDNSDTNDLVRAAGLNYTMEAITELSELLDGQRERDRRIFDSTAIAVRRMIVAAIRKGYSHVGGREAVIGLKNDLLQFGILTISDGDRLNESLDDCYDRAYKMGIATETMGCNTEADWRLEMFKAVCEAETLMAIYGVKVEAKE